MKEKQEQYLLRQQYCNDEFSCLHGAALLLPRASFLSSFADEYPRLFYSTRNILQLPGQCENSQAPPGKKDQKQVVAQASFSRSPPAHHLNRAQATQTYWE